MLVTHNKELQMAKTVADQFADTLAAAGVRRIFGIVGDSLNGLTDRSRADESVALADNSNGAHSSIIRMVKGLT
jgi:hypothetical protein